MWIRFSLRIFAALALASSGLANAKKEALVEQLKTRSDQWLEIETRIVERRSTIKTEEESLNQSVQMLEFLESELKQSVEQSQLKQKSNTDRYREAVEEMEAQEAAMLRLSEKLDTLLISIKPLLASLPKLLEQEVEPHVTIFSDPSAPLANRVQAFLAALTRIEAFDSKISKDVRIHVFEDGSRRELEYLYWGLAFGFARSPDGFSAWRLEPGRGSWEMIELGSEESSAVNRLFAVHGKELTPELVPLNVRVGKGQN